MTTPLTFSSDIKTSLGCAGVRDHKWSKMCLTLSLDMLREPSSNVSTPKDPKAVNAPVAKEAATLLTNGAAFVIKGRSLAANPSIGHFL